MTNKTFPPSHLNTAATSFGTITYLRSDDPIGKALSHYGEWAGVEIEFLRQFIPEGGVAVDIGANIGTHTLAFSRYVGAQGTVYACEPHPQIFNILKENVEANALRNVKLIQAGVGRAADTLYCEPISAEVSVNAGRTELRHQPIDEGWAVKVISLDEMALDRCDFVKIDAEGMEPDVLLGMNRLLNDLKPVLYIECNTIAQGVRVLDRIEGFDYTTMLVSTKAFNQDNFAKRADNFFGVARESALLCLPESGFAEKLVQVAGVRTDGIISPEHFAALHLATPRYGDVDEHQRDVPFLHVQIGELKQHAERLEDELRRLRHRNRLLSQELTMRLSLPAEGIVSERSKSPLRACLSQLSARWVRDPLRRVRIAFKRRA